MWVNIVRRESLTPKAKCGTAAPSVLIEVYVETLSADLTQLISLGIQSRSVRSGSAIIPILFLTKVRKCLQTSLWWSQMANPSSWLQCLLLQLDVAPLVIVTAIFRTRVDVHWGLWRISGLSMFIYWVSFSLTTTLDNILTYSLQLSSPSFTESPWVAPWDKEVSYYDLSDIWGHRSSEQLSDLSRSCSNWWIWDSRSCLLT